MKLLILTQKVDATDDNLGFFHRWIEEFAQHCESVIVVCLYEGTHQLPNNVRVLSLGKEGGSSRSKYLWRFYTYIWRERKNYDAVFVHMNQIYVILGGLIWRLFKKQISLWYAHGTLSLSLRFATLITHYVFTSTAEGFRISSSKRHIVGQGIDTKLFEPKINYTLSNPVSFVTVGRVIPVKHIDLLIEALKMLKKSGASATLDIIGSPDSGNESYLATLQAQVSSAGLEGVVIFRGGVSYTELPNLLPRYDVFVNAGMTGSLDKALLDASAAALPVVSSNPAFRTFVGQSALIGPCEVTPQGLANEIHKVILLSEEDRGWYGKTLRTRVLKNHALPNLVGNICKMMV